MGKVFMVLLALGIGAMPALAETVLKGPAVLEMLSDKTLVNSHDGKSIAQIFQKSGMTLYLENGAQSQGFWKVEGDRYCSQWPPNETWSCYDVLQDGNSVTFVSKSGKRFPMELKVTD
jgi:hypothetical protein